MCTAGMQTWPAALRWRSIDRAHANARLCGVIAPTTTASYFAALRMITCVYAPVRSRTGPSRPLIGVCA